MTLTLTAALGRVTQLESQLADAVSRISGLEAALEEARAEPVPDPHDALSALVRQQMLEMGVLRLQGEERERLLVKVLRVLKAYRSKVEAYVLASAAPVLTPCVGTIRTLMLTHDTTRDDMIRHERMHVCTQGDHV